MELFPGRPVITDIDEMLIDFISLGVFHEASARGHLTGHDLFQAVKNLRREEDEVVDCGDGWFIIANEQTIAMRTLMRIAAVTEGRIIPYKDVANAIVKMAEWVPKFPIAASVRNMQAVGQSILKFCLRTGP